MHFSTMHLLDINNLKPHEEIDPINLDILATKINREGYWFIPVITDEDSGIIMDGHHRYVFALRSGFSVIPCYQLSYSSDKVKVKVFDWKSGAPFSSDQIIQGVNAGILFPPKTTRHIFDMVFDTVKIEIRNLY